MALHESRQQRDPASVLEPNYFSNWGDLWYPRWANKLLVPASRLRFLTPNQVTLASFFLYLASACLIVWGGSWAWLAAVLLPLSYVFDCLDGQLARYTGKTSAVGDYLDKTLDVLKIGIINAAFAAAAWQMTGEVGYVFLGLLSCFGFLFRYYIKLETMFGAINQDPAYLDKSRVRRHALYAALEAERCAPKNWTQQVTWLWSRHRTMFALDEAEHVTFGAIAVGMQRPDCWLWLFGIGQIIIALVRLIQRGRQVASQSETLIDPMRK